MARIADEPMFSSVTASFTGMHAWACHGAIGADFKEDGSATLTIAPPASYAASPCDGLRLRINSGHGTAYGAAEGRLALDQSASVTFAPESEQEIGRLYEHVRRFAGFLMMAIRDPVQPEALRGKIGDAECGIFPDDVPYDRAGGRGRPEAYFTYRQISGGFDGAIGGWYAMCEKYGASMDAYFRARLADRAYAAEARFLHFVQALEAFYRARHADDEPRLEDMLRTLAGECAGAFSGRSAAQEFAFEAAGARRSLSHGFLPSRQRDVPEKFRFLKMTAQAELLAYGCYLNEMALSGSVKGDIMGRRRKEAAQQGYS